MVRGVLVVFPLLVYSYAEALLVSDRHVSVDVLTDLADIVDAAVDEVVGRTVHLVEYSVVALPLVAQRHLAVQLLHLEYGLWDELFDDH